MGCDSGHQRSHRRPTGARCEKGSGSAIRCSTVLASSPRQQHRCSHARPNPSRTFPFRGHVQRRLPGMPGAEQTARQGAQGRGNVKQGCRFESWVRAMLAVPVGESPIGGGARYHRSYTRRREGRPTRRKLGRKSPGWRGGMPAKILQELSNSTGAKANRLNRKITCRPEADAGRKGPPGKQGEGVKHN